MGAWLPLLIGHENACRDLAGRLEYGSEVAENGDEFAKGGISSMMLIKLDIAQQLIEEKGCYETKWQRVGRVECKR